MIILSCGNIIEIDKEVFMSRIDKLQTQIGAERRDGETIQRQIEVHSRNQNGAAVDFWTSLLKKNTVRRELIEKQITH